MANMVEQGDSPFLTPAKLAEIGYKIAVYPITLILAGIRAMEEALAKMKAGGGHPERLAEFAHLRDIVGFPDYYEAEKKYRAD
jgi:2-methylisocitrate lyase-like PEP mutase family enzyme